MYFFLILHSSSLPPSPQFFQGCVADEQGQQGQQIAWLQLSLQKLTTIGKIPKSLGDVKEAARNFFDYVNERLQVVKRQNDQVYHEPIPESDTLEQTTGKRSVPLCT